MPVEIDILKSLQSGIAIDWAVPFNICPEIPSGPVALDMSISSNKSLTMSGVLNIDSSGFCTVGTVWLQGLN